MQYFDYIEETSASRAAKASTFGSGFTCNCSRCVFAAANRDFAKIEEEVFGAHAAAAKMTTFEGASMDIAAAKCLPPARRKTLRKLLAPLPVEHTAVCLMKLDELDIGTFQVHNRFDRAMECLAHSERVGRSVFGCYRVDYLRVLIRMGVTALCMSNHKKCRKMLTKAFRLFCLPPHVPGFLLSADDFKTLVGRYAPVDCRALLSDIVDEVARELK